MKTKKLAAFAAIYLIWGSTYLAIRMAIDSVPPFLMAGARYLAAGVPLYLWLRRRGAARPSAIHWRSAFVVGTLMLLGGNGMVTWSEQWVPTGIAAVFIACVSLWMTVLDALFFGGPRLSGLVLAGVGLGILGVGVLAGPSSADVHSVAPIGVAGLLVASLSWAIGSLHSRRARLPESPFVATAMEMVGGGIALLTLATLTGEWSRLDLSGITLRSGLAFVYLVVFGSIVALSAYVWLLRVSSASSVSTYAFVNPAVALFLGWAIFGEILTPRITLGTVMILGAVVLLHWARVRPARSLRVVAGESSQGASA